MKISKELRKKMEETEETIVGRIVIKDNLEKLVKEGRLEKNWDEYEQDYKYGFSKNGLKETEKDIKNSLQMRLFLFQLQWNMDIKENPNKTKLERLMEQAKLFKDKFKTNLFQDLIAAEEKGYIKKFFIRKEELKKSKLIKKIYEKL